MGSKLEVTLIPWDADSIPHRQVLSIQREECGWDQDKVDTQWKDEQTRAYQPAGIGDISNQRSHLQVLQSNDSRDSQTLDESNVLRDTAPTINAVPRKALGVSFVPIGHISLDSANTHTGSIDLGLPSTGVFWIKTFYVKHEFQSQGVGRAAMDKVEDMATKEPLNATTLALDTMQRDDQLREDFAVASFGSVPKVTNEDWYSRRGYRLITTVQNYYRSPDRFGKIWDIRTVFMRKDIRQEIPSPA